MAALGKIRSRGTILIIIIGFGLFAFIAEELFRSCETTSNDRRQQVGEVLGEKISVNDFQKLVDDYSDVIKMQQGTDNIPDDQMNQVKDMVWNTYVQSHIVEKEAKKLGLRVTDGEMQNILNEGTNPMLLQTPFVNQQTGRFDATALQKFLAEYKANQNSPSANPQEQEQYDKIYKYWTFIEKTLRQQVLAQKYQSLFAHCFLSNPVEAKMAFKEENQESSIQLAAFPYADINDSQVKITRGDLEKKYDELKLRFKQPVESRDISYVDYHVVASRSDRSTLMNSMNGYQKQLASAADPTDVVRKSESTIPYLGVPAPKAFYPADIAADLDSISVGTTTKVMENRQDNTLNILKVMSKASLPDSVQYRSIQVMASTPAASRVKADSIMKALQKGADFEALAKKSGQTGNKMWVTSQQLIGSMAQSASADNRKMVTALQSGQLNAYANISLTQGNIIVQVTDRQGFKDNYQVAVIKKPIEFSKDTYRNAYNKFSAFVSANQTAGAIAKDAAHYGYKLQSFKDLTTATHYVGNVHSTRDALKWIFDGGTHEGDVSPLYECGDNDHLMVVILNKIHRVGYRDLDDPQVMAVVKAEVMKDKKAAMIIAKLKGVNSIAAAKAKGAKVSAVNQVTFAAPVFVSATGASEPALSGAVYATAKGKFVDHPVKGEAGVYLFAVVNKTMLPVKFDEKTEEQKLRQKEMQYASNFMQELYLNAHVVDNRYLFF
ncbi:SurA N-terminal domain-containing protein [Prevotella cerevisiae]|uniref:SurA N-terminal domain-containing protein n=1 Tax=Segatella cerevisiae TaxID=2053716 RepID=A0ABT1BXM9_9BACT|nr:peptidylprolyl isomerase [Segatella cerevisiae]MCO6025824.1 SurA N-terminal domain-containing protein [Segatella cerevisiae]